MLFTCCIGHFKVLMKGGNSYKSSAGVMQSSLPVFFYHLFIAREKLHGIIMKINVFVEFFFFLRSILACNAYYFTSPIAVVLFR